MKQKLLIALKWLPIVLLALPMVAAGGAKLAGVEAVHQSFEAMGLPTWFGYFIGAAEVAGGIGLLIPRLSAWAATGLAPIMAGAVYFHIAYAVPSFVPALVFLILCGYAIAIQRKKAVWYPV
ncbi:DoxX family protein [Salinibius halmophilus]|uniref:DoxX family protein n=1 Tax=Salinibius halmophilus TaxID=1853216 RepID=UPI000E66A477|nr:DoxX family protein [Salinibius halmophilus]